MMRPGADLPRGRQSGRRGGDSFRGFGRLFGRIPALRLGSRAGLNQPAFDQSVFLCGEDTLPLRFPELRQQFVKACVTVGIVAPIGAKSKQDPRDDSQNHQQTDPGSRAGKQSVQEFRPGNLRRVHGAAFNSEGAARAAVRPPPPALSAAKRTLARCERCPSRRIAHRAPIRGIESLREPRIERSAGADLGFHPSSQQGERPGVRGRGVLP